MAAAPPDPAPKRGGRPLPQGGGGRGFVRSPKSAGGRQHDARRSFLYAREFFGAEPDYPWDSEPDYAVLRHGGSKKWFGVIMRIPRCRLGLDGDEQVDILNVKCDPRLIGSLILKEGYFKAYHMSKEHWLTLLIGELSEEEVTSLLTVSYDLTK